MLRARQDFLDIREERQSAPPEELYPLPRLLDCPPERLAGIRPTRERVERLLEVLDRAGVIPFSDRPPGVAKRDIGLVRVESLALQTGVQDLGIGDAGRRLAVRIADDVDLLPGASCLVASCSASSSSEAAPSANRSGSAGPFISPSDSIASSAKKMLFEAFSARSWNARPSCSARSTRTRASR